MPDWFFMVVENIDVQSWMKDLRDLKGRIQFVDDYDYKRMRYEQ